MSAKNKTSYLNSDLRFLVSCCKTDPSKDDIAFIHSILNAENLVVNSDTSVIKTKKGCNTKHLTLNTLIGLANQHGILPLIYKTLKKLSEDGILRHTENKIHETQKNSNTELSAFRQKYLSIARRNMLMSAELIKITNLLKEHSIKSLAFKGPALSQMAYGDITLRQYSDLDILIRKEDIYKIETLLKIHGYKRLLTLTPIQESIRLKYAQDISFIHPEKGIHIEMHWSLLNINYPIHVGLKNFWKETQEVKLNSHTISTFSTENLIIYLAIHGSKHLWERIEWVKDIDLLIQKQEINWKKLIEKVQGTGFENMVYLGLHLNVILFKTSLPESIHLEIKKCQPIEQLSDFVFESWVNSKSSFQTTHIQTKLLPGFKKKIIYLHTRLFKPSLDEYLYVDLPKGLHWGYYLVKPYRLIKKHLFKS